MCTSDARLSGRLQGESVPVPVQRRTESPGDDHRTTGHPSMLSNMFGAPLFADVADASGGRIAVFYRCGSTALELRGPFAG